MMITNEDDDASEPKKRSRFFLVVKNNLIGNEPLQGYLVIHIQEHLSSFHIKITPVILHSPFPSSPKTMKTQQKYTHPPDSCSQRD